MFNGLIILSMNKVSKGKKAKMRELAAINEDPRYENQYIL
jgi:hypothetical protein